MALKPSIISVVKAVKIYIHVIIIDCWLNWHLSAHCFGFTGLDIHVLVQSHRLFQVSKYSRQFFSATRQCTLPAVDQPTGINGYWLVLVNIMYIKSEVLTLASALHKNRAIQMQNIKLAVSSPHGQDICTMCTYANAVQLINLISQCCVYSLVQLFKRQENNNK